MPPIKDTPPAKARAVLLAGDSVGGLKPLAAILGVRGEDIESWLAGTVPLPEQVYQQCVNIVVDCLLDDLGISRAKAKGPLH